MADVTITLGSGSSVACYLGDQYTYNPPIFDGWYSLNRGYAIAFTPYTSFVLTSATLGLSRLYESGGTPGDIAGTMTLTVCEDASGPFGTVVGTATKDRTTIAYGYSLVQFDFAALPTLGTTKYWLKIEDPNSLNYSPDSYADNKDYIALWSANSADKEIYYFDAGSYAPTDGWEPLPDLSYPKDIQGHLDGPEAEVELTKPTTPTPADASGPGINFTNRTLSWVNGGGATGYRVKFPFANAIDVGASTSYVIPESMIPSFNQTTVSWRVDATDGTDWVTGDTWTFDPRPAKVTTPSPANSATSINKALDKMSWTASTHADKHIITSSFSSGTIELEGAELVLATYTPTTLNPLGYSKTYTWSVDANNVWGTTEGDNWTFTTENLTFPRAIYYYPGTGFYYLIWDDDTQTWGDPPPVGTIDVDYHVVTYVNFIASHRRLVAASADQLWYESL